MSDTDKIPLLIACDRCGWKYKDSLTLLNTGTYRCKTYFYIGKCEGDMLKDGVKRTTMNHNRRNW